MTDHQLHHDPLTKSQIKDAIWEQLYTPVEAQFKKRLDHIINRNTVLGNFSHASFMYKNEIYTCDPNPLPRKMNRLLPQLQQEMNEYLKDKKELNEKEVPYVMGYINQVLNSTNDLADYLRLFPSAVHGPVQKLIDSCPCKQQRMPEEMVQLIQQKNTMAITLMKRRMVTNLLI